MNFHFPTCPDAVQLRQVEGRLHLMGALAAHPRPGPAFRAGRSCLRCGAGGEVLRLKAAPLDIPDFVAVLDAPAGSNLSEAAGEPWSLGLQQLGAEWGDD